MREECFLQIAQIKGWVACCQNKILLWIFGNLALKLGGVERPLIQWSVEGGGANIFYTLSVIIRSLIYLIIRFTLHNVLWV